jgi:hypothetical protein
MHEKTAPIAALTGMAEGQPRRTGVCGAAVGRAVTAVAGVARLGRAVTALR